jgi:hypothetical protein
VPDDYPIIRTEPATAAKVRIPTALMQPHDAVDATAQQLGDVQIGTKSAIGQQDLTGLQQMPKPASQRDIVMVLVVVSHLQKRSTVQAEKADDFELGKTTAGLLSAILWPLELVGSRIWHREPRSVGNFDAPAQPDLLVGDPAFKLLGHLGANLLEHCLIEPGGDPPTHPMMLPSAKGVSQQFLTFPVEERIAWIKFLVGGWFLASQCHKSTADPPIRLCLHGAIKEAQHDINRYVIEL